MWKRKTPGRSPCGTILCHSTVEHTDNKWWKGRDVTETLPHKKKKKTCEFLQKCRVCMLCEPWQTDVFITTLFAVVLSDSSLFCPVSLCVCAFSLYTGLHLLFRKKIIIILDMDSSDWISVWVTFQWQQFVHIWVHIPVTSGHVWF